MSLFFRIYLGSKTGDAATGITNKVVEILKERIGSGLRHTQEIKWDNDSQLAGDEIKEELNRLRISMDNSSAKYPSENLHTENSVKCVKRPIAYCRYRDSHELTMALNMNQPYDNTNLTPFEELHGMYTAGRVKKLEI